MAPASPQQKFDLGVAKVRELPSRRIVTVDDVNEAWSALRTGIVAARKAEDCLDSCAEEERPRILEFMLERGVQKKSARGQVKECLRILLARPVWLASAKAEEGLSAGMIEALDASQDADLLAQLVPPQPQVDMEAVETPCVDGEQAPECEEDVADAPQDAKPRPLDIREKMARGKAVLQGFGWEFPRDPTGTRGDEATTGFMFLFDAVTALSTSSGRASVGGEPSAALAGWEEDWANLLQFLLSMYTSGVRRTYSRRIRFVVVQLRALAPAFWELAPWVSLPWGHEEMPKEEAEAEARVLEEFRKQQEEQAEDERLARALQEEEEEEQVRLELVQTPACKLEEEKDTTQPSQALQRPQQRAGWALRRGLLSLARQSRPLSALRVERRLRGGA